MDVMVSCVTPDKFIPSLSSTKCAWSNIDRIQKMLLCSRQRCLGLDLGLLSVENGDGLPILSIIWALFLGALRCRFDSNNSEALSPGGLSVSVWENPWI